MKKQPGCLHFLGQMQTAANVGHYPIVIPEFAVSNFFLTWLNIPKSKKKFCWQKGCKKFAAIIL